MEELLREFFIIALLSTLCTYACHKIKIPPIVGFLITGAIFGPSALGLVQNAESVVILSEIGIVFLLFSIGMELSVSELIRLRKPVLLGGSIQVVLTIFLFAVLALWYWPEQGLNNAIFVGFLIALSSTAIVLKILQQKAQIDTPSGKITLSILIYQDLVIIPMMLAIPLLAGANTPDFSMDLVITAVGYLAMVIIMFTLTRYAVPWLLKKVINTNSREMFLIATIGVCLGTAYFTEQLGLSISLGAFMAGLIVAESEYSHSALEGILPFRDVFTSIFFISVGMLLNMQFFFDNILLILAITLLIIGFKALIAGGDAIIMGYPIRPAVIVGLSLCQVGEFSLVLAKVGLDSKLLSVDNYQLFLAASILTMTATPFLMNLAPRFAKRLDALRAKNAITDEDELPTATNQISDHLIIIGYGVGGKLLARAARVAGIPFVILEMNPDTVRFYAEKGEPIFYGDATHPAMLTHLGLHRARVLCVMISDHIALRSITQIARHMSKNVHILVRTRFLGDVPALQELGANSVIPEEFETAIEIFTRILSKYLVPRNEIDKFTSEVRAENYEMLRKPSIEGTTLGALQKHMPDLSVAVFTMEEYAPLAGMSLQESNLRQKADLTVVAVQRGQELFTHPGGDFKMQPSDNIYVFATPQKANQAEHLFLAKGKA